MKKMKNLALLLVVSVIGIFVLTGCGDGDSSDEKQVVKIPYPNWVEGVSMTHLAKVILEDKMDYEVDISMADIGVIFTSLSEGESDFLLDSWLPVFHKDYMEKYKDELVDLGPNFKNAVIGITVPQYIEEVNSMEDLAKYKEEFDGEVVGIDSGANMMNTTDEALEAYDTGFELLRGSEPVMTAALGDAIDNEEWIAVLGWQPHWKFARWDLKFLDDPKNIFGDAEMVHTIARSDIKEDLPEVAEFFENFEFNDDEIADLILSLEGEDDKLEACRTWVEENEELVDSWIPEKQ